MIIELFGLPASGKTTYAKSEQQKGVYVVKSNFLEAVFWHIVFLIRFPIFSVKSIFLMIINFKGFADLFRKYVFLFLRRTAHFSKARIIKKSKIIIDEGLLQNILSFCETNIKDSFLESYIRSMPKADLIIVFELGEQQRLNNLLNRTQKGRETLNSDFGVWNENARINFQKIVTLLGRANIKYIFNESHV